MNIYKDSISEKTAQNLCSTNYTPFTFPKRQAISFIDTRQYCIAVLLPRACKIIWFLTDINTIWLATDGGRGWVRADFLKWIAQINRNKVNRPQHNKGCKCLPLPLWLWGPSQGGSRLLQTEQSFLSISKCY